MPWLTIATQRRAGRAGRKVSHFHPHPPALCCAPKAASVATPTSSKAQAGLKEKLLTMASYAEAAVNRAVKALVRRDDDLARRTREEDDRIDALDARIKQAEEAKRNM